MLHITEANPLATPQVINQVTTTLTDIWADNEGSAHIADIVHLTGLDQPMQRGPKYALIAGILDALAEADKIIDNNDDTYHELDNLALVP